MGRLKRFEDYRFVGTRDTMKVYDCDDDAQLKTLERRLGRDDLGRRDLLQSFAPDTIAEAANRGFHQLD
ncbi:MAG: hypothetical protein ACRDVD_03315 [Acidimicrobiia bacterium]